MHRLIVAALTAILLVSLTPNMARSGMLFLLDKTVGTGAQCAPGNMLTVVQGTPVTYCYTGRNTSGDLTLVTHTINDSVLGNIETNLVSPIVPMSSLSLTRTFTPCATVTNVATWIARLSDDSASLGAFDAAMVTVEEPSPSFLLTKTVSTDGACPGVAQDVVLAGAKVVYCYEVGNNGNIALTVHTLVDSELGAIMISPLVLAPGQETLASAQSAIINQDTVNDATATAVLTISCEDQMTVTRVQASDSAEVLVADPTPALENAALIVAALMLLGIGGLSLSRRRRLE